MSFQELERKYYKFSIPNLNIILTAFYTAGLIIQVVDPFIYLRYLSLNTEAFLKGEIWRAITFLIYPPSGSVRGTFGILLAALIIYVYYSLTTVLLRVWGSFKFTWYFVIGVICQVLGGIIIGLVLHERLIITPSYLVFSIFIAFALTFPDSQFLYMFLIPIKAKYLAYIELAIYIFNIFLANKATKVAIIMSLVNVAILIFATNKDFFHNLFNKNKYNKY